MAARGCAEREEAFLALHGGEMDGDGFGNGPCVTLHVRRADIALNIGFDGKGKGLPYTPLWLYAKAAERLLGPGRGRPRDLLVMSDDANVMGAIEELKELTGWRWIYVRRPRWHGTEGGWENHFPSGDPKQELISIQLEFRLAARCRGGFVGTPSMFGDMMFHYMCVRQDAWDCPPTLRLPREANRTGQYVTRADTVAAQQVRGYRGAAVAAAPAAAPAPAPGAAARLATRAAPPQLPVP